MGTGMVLDCLNEDFLDAINPVLFFGSAMRLGVELPSSCIAFYT